MWEEEDSLGRCAGRFLLARGRVLVLGVGFGLQNASGRRKNKYFTERVWSRGLPHTCQHVWGVRGVLAKLWRHACGPMHVEENLSPPL